MGTWLSRQVRRGHDRPPLLRRLPERRHRRDARRRARPRAVRRAVRLRPAALRHRRQPGRLLVDPGPPRRVAGARAAGAKNVNDLSEDDWETLRHEFGNQRLLGMSLDAGGHLTHGFRPNISGKMFHQQQYGTDPETGLLDYDVVRGQGPRVQAAGADRRLLGLPAPGQLRQDARDRRRGRRDADGRHGPLRRPGRRQGVHRRRGPGAARPRHDHDDPQVAARPARRHGAGQQEFADAVDRGCPMVLGGPLVARDGGQGGRARRGPAAVVPDLRAGDRRQREVAGRGLPDARRDAWSPAAPTTTSCCSTSRRSASPAGRPSRRCSTPASSPTATPCPADPNGAWYTSGVRIGTPALTSRGFGADEFDRVAELIVDVLCEHRARHHQGRRAVEGEVHARPTASPTGSRPPARRCSTPTRSTRGSTSRRAAGTRSPLP